MQHLFVLLPESTLISVCWKDALDKGDDIFLSTASKPAVLFRPIGEDDLTDVYFQVFENCVKISVQGTSTNTGF